ncbi:hypothetical protein GF362_03425 [Candidatus Dojkabacteria bacterium]|nr:hypothetical protein [Candidatus Dojkabacteria bacterium]
MYIRKACVDIVYMDQIRWVNSDVEDFLENDFNYSSLWEPINGSHRTPIKRMMFLLNAKYFHLNTFVERYIGLFMLVCTGILLYYYYRQSLPKEIKSLKAQVGYGLLIMILFSLSQWALIHLSMGGFTMFKNFLYMIYWGILNYFLKQRVKGFYTLLILVLSIILLTSILGSGSILSLIGTTIIVFIINAIFQKRVDKNFIISMVAIIFTGIICLVFYSRGTDSVGGQGVFGRIEYLTGNFVKVLEFIALTLSSSVLHSRHGEFRLLWFEIFMGLGVFLLHLYSLYTFFKHKFYKKSYIPIFIQISSWITIIGILVVRFAEFGESVGKSPRYITHLQYGVIAIVWILLIKFFSEKISDHNRFGIEKRLIASVLILIMSFQFITYIYEWRTYKDKRAYYEKNRKVALNYQRIEPEKIKYQSGVEPEELVEAFTILEKYKLNMFHDYNSD